MYTQSKSIQTIVTKLREQGCILLWETSQQDWAVILLRKKLK